MQTVVTIFCLVLIVGACGVVPRSAQHPVRAGDSVPSTNAEVDSIEKTDPPPPAVAASSLDDTKSALMQAYREWEGTPYVLGGSSHNGVDCSRFVNIVFDDYFDIELPKNTRAQLNEGNGIRRAAIKTGDLVFFRTGRKTLHVGIAVNRGEFLHASTSSGVMISKLGNSYWRDRFLAARRLL